MAVSFFSYCELGLRSGFFIFDDCAGRASSADCRGQIQHWRCVTPQADRSASRRTQLWVFDVLHQASNITPRTWLSSAIKRTPSARLQSLRAAGFARFRYRDLTGQTKFQHRSVVMRRCFPIARSGGVRLNFHRIIDMKIASAS